MKYIDINPELTSKIVKSAGFEFDGYYYVHKMVDLKLSKVPEGFKVFTNRVEIDSSKLIISDYSHLIRLMVSALPVYIGKLMNAKYSSKEHMESVLSDKLNQYWGFDKDLSFTVAADPNGLHCLPGNEYTLSLTRDDLKKFKITYCDELNDKIDLIIESSPYAISYKYLKKLINLEFQCDAKIESVKSIEDDGNEIPFFGVGM